MKTLQLEPHNFRVEHAKKWKVSPKDKELLVSPSGDIWEIIGGDEAGEQLFTWDAAIREAKKQKKRMPTDDEMTELMKTKSDIPNLVLTGYRYTNGTFYSRGVSTLLWSSSESGTNAWTRHLYSGYSTTYRDTHNKAYGFSVRCLKESPPPKFSRAKKEMIALADKEIREWEKFKKSILTSKK